MTDQVERRRATRAMIDCQVEGRRPSEQRMPIRLRDLTPHGCRVEIAQLLKPDQRMWINLPGIEGLLSTARWADHCTIGVEFDRPMHVAVCDWLRARLR
jgi:hypothetical protein